MKRLFVLVALALFVPPAATLPTGNRAAPVQLSFGVYLTDKPTTVYRQFTPILEALQERMEAQIASPVSIELEIFKTYDAGIEALVKGQVDFVRFGPASYVLAKQRNTELQLLAMELKKGKKRFPGAIVVQRDSPIRSFADLRGKRIAFGDKNSTIGRYLSQSLLVSKGITADDLSSYEYFGRHDKVATAVMYGDADAGALKASTLKKLDSRKTLRVLAEFENVTKPWIARAGLPTSTSKALTEALIALDDEEALTALKVTGFAVAKDKEYDFVRSAMKKAAGFDPGN